MRRNQTHPTTWHHMSSQCWRPCLVALTQYLLGTNRKLLCNPSELVMLRSASLGTPHTASRVSHALSLAGSPMGQPSYSCSVLFARAPVLGLCFFVSVTRDESDPDEYRSSSPPASARAYYASASALAVLVSLPRSLRNPSSKGLSRRYPPPKRSLHTHIH